MMRENCNRKREEYEKTLPEDRNICKKGQIKPEMSPRQIICEQHQGRRRGIGGTGGWGGGGPNKILTRR